MTEDGKKVVFISGPVTGKDDYYKAFDAAEWELARQGHVVLNPAILPADLPDASYMPICIAMLEQSDAVYVLKGWRESAGARTEVAYAERQGKIVIYEEDDKNAES